MGAGANADIVAKAPVVQIVLAVFIMSCIGGYFILMVAVFL